MATTATCSQSGSHSSAILRLQRNTLRSLGFRLRTDAESPVWRLCVAVHTVSVALIVLPQVYFVRWHLAELTLSTNAMCTVMYCFMALPKLVTMQLRRATWYRLLDRLDELWRNGN